MKMDRRLKYAPGMKFGLLTLLERDAGTSHWFAECECGERCRVRPYKLRTGSTRTCGIAGRHYRTDDPAYFTVHSRLKNRRGVASLNACLHCGGRATDWAYDGTDPSERLQDGKPYSLDLEKYVPLCKSCHIRFDGTQWLPGSRPDQEKWVQK